jgi:DNA processing protein
MRSSGSREAHAASLAGLPGMTPRRLASVIGSMDPVDAWRSVVSRHHPFDRDGSVAAVANHVDVNEVSDRYRDAGVTILLPTTEGYPSMLIDDPGRPAVLFARGDPSVLTDRHRVAIVGTRSATPYGRQVASELGRDLTAAGVVVVSGLARGIDGAAHAGALQSFRSGASRPVAVVGTGLDVVYPRSNAALWKEVAGRGVVFSESPLGTPPLAGVFPARNRIIAGLVDVVVVVESHYRGGSLYTAEAAARRSIPVAAVPGSVRSRASEGTNGLLVDGCIPVRDATDVLVAISLARSGRDAPSPVQQAATLVAARGNDRRGETRRGDARSAMKAGSLGPSNGPPMAPTLTTEARSVLASIDATPTSFETILSRTDMGIAAVARICDDLVAHRLLRSGDGWWSTP